MADEEELESCNYLSFADRYQADLELIYQKYEQLEDGCYESQEILLSNFGHNGESDELDWLDDFLDDEIDLEPNNGSDGLSDDEGWESDSSGHTREISSQDEVPNQSPTRTKLHKDGQNCEVTEKGKSMQFKQPLSSTLACDSTGLSEIKMDPKLSPVELQSNNNFKGLEKQHIALPNHVLDQGPSCSFMPGILSENVLTSTKLESSPDLPTIRHKLPAPQKNALSPLAITSHMGEERAITDITDENPGPEGLSSFAQAVLNTRNKIANVLFKAVMNFQKGNSSSDSGYESLSTDTASSSSTIQSTSKESLFLPDKLLKEFSNRLTTEMMSNGNCTSRLSEPNHSPVASNSLTRRTQSIQKTKMTSGHNGMASKKNRTVSLQTGRKTIKFNPSLPGLEKGMSSTPLSNEKGSVYIPLSLNSKTLDGHGRLKTSVSTKAVLKISPVQNTSPTALVPKNAVSITSGLSETPAPQESPPLKLIQNNQTPVILKLPQEQKKQPLMRQNKPVIKLQESVRPCVATSRRRSVSLTNCLPVTDSEILRHSTKLSDFQRYMQQHERRPEELPGSGLPGQNLRGSSRNTPMWRERGDDYEQQQRATLKVHPELCLIPGQDGTKAFRRLPGQNGVGYLGQKPLGSSRKRSFDSALLCVNEKTSPKRTCWRSNEDEDKASLGKGLWKLGAGKEKIVGGLTNKNERIKKRRDNLLVVNRNNPEVFDDMEIYGDKRKCVKSSSKEDEGDAVERKQQRHYQKLFTEGTKSSCSFVKVNSCHNMKIPWKTGDISPSYRDRRTQQLIRGNTLEEFKKIFPENRRTGEQDSTARAAFSSEKSRRSSSTKTSQDYKGNCCKDYRRSSYESATEESYYSRCNTASRNIKKCSSETQFFTGRSSRPVLELGDQDCKTSNRNKSPLHQFCDSPSSNSHTNLTSRKKVCRGVVEKASTGEIHFSRRKTNRKHEGTAQGSDHGICLNKTFKIDKVPRILETCDSYTSGRCTKLFCLNCGNFPSTIQDDDSVYEDSEI